jgi:hypothetical protein
MTRGRDDRARYSNFWEQIDLTAIRFCDMIERRYDLSIIGVCPTEVVFCVVRRGESLWPVWPPTCSAPSR